MDKIWLAHYPKNIPHEIDPNSYSSLVDMFHSACHQFANNVAYVNMGHTLSYRALDKLSQDFSAYLQNLGLKKGDRVAIMMPNLLQYPIALFGILRAGLVVVNVNPLYTDYELTHQINDSGAKALLVLENFAHTVELALPNMPSLEHIIITRLADQFPSLKRFLINAVVKYIKRMVPKYSLPQATCFRKALKAGAINTFNPVTIKPTDMAFLQYTGGTTGVAKGAVLTHHNMVANVLQATAWLTPLSLGPTDVVVTALPLYHIFSLTANCLTFLCAGAKNILITNPRDIKSFIRDIKHSQFTATTGVNTLFKALIRHPDWSSVDFSKLKLTLSGGMALEKNVSLLWHEQTHAPILEAYGLTETSPAVTINPMTLTEYNGSIGLPLPSTLVSIRDLEGNELPLGEKGELCVKGPQVMTEYWNKPEETKKVFWNDGYLRTGDIAKMDEQGFVYLVDRLKDMILVSGFNVYPHEIEEVIGLMPEVLEVAVIGVNNGDSTEKVKACIVKRDEILTEEQVIQHARKHLTAYKVPKIIEFYPDLPKSNVGKILKRDLK